MSLAQVVYNISTDSDFAAKMRRDPEGALAGKAEVEVEVEYVTPAELVLRASGKFLNRSQVPLSPQSPESLTR